MFQENSDSWYLYIRYKFVQQLGLIEKGGNHNFQVALSLGEHYENVCLVESKLFISRKMGYDQSSN